MPTKKQNGKSVNKIKTRRRSANVRRKCQDGGGLKDLWRAMRMEKWLRNNRVVPMVVMTEDEINPLYAQQQEATATSARPTSARPTSARPTRPTIRPTAFADVAAVAESNATTCADLPQDVFNIIAYKLDSSDSANLALTSKDLLEKMQKNFTIVKLTQQVQYGHDTILLMIARIFNKINTTTQITLGNITFNFTTLEGTKIKITVGESGIVDLGTYVTNTYYARVLRDIMANKVTISNLTLPMLNKFFEQRSVNPHINNTDIRELRELVYNQKELTQHPAILSIVKSELNDPKKQQCEKHKDLIVAIPSSLFDALTTLGIKNSFDYLISMLYYLDTRDKSLVEINENYGMAKHCFKQLIRLKHNANVNALLEIKVTDVTDVTVLTAATEQNYKKMEGYIVEKITDGTKDVKQMQFCLLHICDTIYSRDFNIDQVLNYTYILSRFFHYAYAYTYAIDPLNEFISGLHVTITETQKTVKPHLDKDIDLTSTEKAIQLFKTHIENIKDELLKYIFDNEFWDRIINMGNMITNAAANNSSIQNILMPEGVHFFNGPKEYIEGDHLHLVDTTFEDYDRIKNWGDIFIYMNDTYINHAMKDIKFETKDNSLEVTYDNVLKKHLESTSKFDEFIASVIKFDLDTMRILFPNLYLEAPQPEGQEGKGGKKPTAYKKTDMRYEYNGRNRIVYVGKRGGKYIQIKNKMIPVSKLN
jgi:hypothetical protein